MIVVLLPAYNEEASLPRLMPKLREVLDRQGEPYRIVTCNDGSRDGTREVLQQMIEQYPLEVLTHKINRGLGETSRDLFERAAEIASTGDVIVRLDCDDTHEPEFMPRLISKVREGYDVVIASRFAPGGGQLGVGPYRAFISRCANLFMKVFFPIEGLREYSCGFRAYRAEAIQKAIACYGNNFIQLKGLGFTCTLEKLVKLKLVGARFAEAPFVLRYDQKLSDSKMVSSITTLGYIVMTIMYHWPWGGWRTAARRQAPARDSAGG
ncbi:MAG: glycosyltransferase family 2 protein [Ideonella sp.]|nr:MAG: glycosyltransferase family 2 protein [Burkholderiaceae bacterium]MBE7426203.1 glycosyltransferase family 2 protein [Ideonella sp.]